MGVKDFLLFFSSIGHPANNISDLTRLLFYLRLSHVPCPVSYLRVSCTADCYPHDPGSSRRKVAMPTREQAWTLLCEYTQNESLRKHALAVEACVRAYAKKRGADEELWGITALLHDFDYERWPNDAHSPTEEHPAGGSAILRDHGYSEETIRAILSHAEYSGVPRVTPLEHTLFACDELAGFLTACALVKPSKSIFAVEPDSVKRKLKDKAFARGVNRDDVRKGADELGVPIEEHIAACIAAMREQAVPLGLQGYPPSAAS